MVGDGNPCVGEQRERCYLSGQVLDSLMMLPEVCERDCKMFSQGETCVVKFMCGPLCVSSVVFRPVHRYIDAVKPGRYGIPKPFYFPFLPSYWTGRPRKVQCK